MPHVACMHCSYDRLWKPRRDVVSSTRAHARARASFLNLRSGPCSGPCVVYRVLYSAALHIYAPHTVSLISPSHALWVSLSCCSPGHAPGPRTLFTCTIPEGSTTAGSAQHRATEATQTHVRVLVHMRPSPRCRVFCVFIIHGAAARRRTCLQRLGSPFASCTHEPPCSRTM